MFPSFNNKILFHLHSSNNLIIYMKGDNLIYRLYIHIYLCIVIHTHENSYTHTFFVHIIEYIYVEMKYIGYLNYLTLNHLLELFLPIQSRIITLSTLKCYIGPDPAISCIQGNLYAGKFHDLNVATMGSGVQHMTGPGPGCNIWQGKGLWSDSKRMLCLFCRQLQNYVRSVLS